MTQDPEGGVAVLGSVWTTPSEMSGSQDTEAPLRAELASRAGGPVTVEHYRVPVYKFFEQQAPPVRGYAIRLTPIRVRPSQVDDAIECAAGFIKEMARTIAATLGAARGGEQPATAPALGASGLRIFTPALVSAPSYSKLDTTISLALNHQL